VGAHQTVSPLCHEVCHERSAHTLTHRKHAFSHMCTDRGRLLPISGYGCCRPYTPLPSPDVRTRVGICSMHVSQVWSDNRRADGVHERERVQSQLQAVECTSHLRPPCPSVETLVKESLSSNISEQYLSAHFGAAWTKGRECGVAWSATSFMFRAHFPSVRGCQLRPIRRVSDALHPVVDPQCDLISPAAAG